MRITITIDIESASEEPALDAALASLERTIQEKREQLAGLEQLSAQKGKLTRPTGE